MRGELALGLALVSACSLDREGGAQLVGTTDASGPSDAPGDLVLEAAGGSGPSDASKDVVDAGPGCGALGQECCASGATCSAGACLAGRCVEFGGAFERHTAFECSNLPCQNSNPFAASNCACPGGFTEQKLAVTTDCAGPGKQVRTELVLCHASATYAGSDYAGAYQAVPLGLPCPPTNGCVAPNPYTGSCACPAGSEPLAFAMDLPVCGGASFVDGVLVMCWKPDADKSTFDGAHLVNDLAPFCPFPHPQTATCECPDAAGAYGMRLLRKEQGVLIGAVMYLCRPGETP